MLLYFDRTSMARSLEVRVPYLDHRLVEWAATVPVSMKVKRGVTKRVLKEAGLQLLPSQTVRKPKVGLFRSALDVWLEAVAGRTGRRAPSGGGRRLPRASQSIGGSSSRRRLSTQADGGRGAPRVRDPVARIVALNVRPPSGSGTYLVRSGNDGLPRWRIFRTRLSVRLRRFPSRRKKKLTFRPVPC
jgi:hypothetical protein